LETLGWPNPTVEKYTFSQACLYEEDVHSSKPICFDERIAFLETMDAEKFSAVEDIP
jgi:hypothetical protein